MHVIGLTGGIGSGKTAVSDRFAALGVDVVDTDMIAHALTGPRGPAMAALIDSFGPGICTPDGALDRAAMRQRVFSSDAVRKQLEAVLHPMIRTACNAAIAAARGPYVVCVVPLLIESGDWQRRVHRVLVVDCLPATQVQRVMARSALSEPEVQAIIARQATRAQRLAAADDVIYNDGITPDELGAQVAVLHAHYAALAAAD